MRDDLELRLTAWLEDGPVRASDAFVDATFAPVPHLRRRRGWQARLGSLLGAGLSIPAGRVMRLAMVGALALLILSVVAFGGGGLMQPAPSPTPPPAPRVMFTLTTDRLPTRTFHEVANPGLDTCVTLGDAPWRLIYAGGSEPFISLDVVVWDGAATRAGSNRVAAEIQLTSPDFYVRLDPALLRGGDHEGRSTASVTVTSKISEATMTISAVTPERTTGADGPPVTVDLTIVCRR